MSSGHSAWSYLKVEDPIHWLKQQIDGADIPQPVRVHMHQVFSSTMKSYPLSRFNFPANADAAYGLMAHFMWATLSHQLINLKPTSPKYSLISKSLAWWTVHARKRTSVSTGAKDTKNRRRETPIAAMEAQDETDLEELG